MSKKLGGRGRVLLLVGHRERKSRDVSLPKKMIISQGAFGTLTHGPDSVCRREDFGHDGSCLEAEGKYLLASRLQMYGSGDRSAHGKMRTDQV